MMITKNLLRVVLLLIGVSVSGCASNSPNAEINPVMVEPESSENTTPGYLFVTGWYKDSAVQKEYTKNVGPVIRQHNFVNAKVGLPGVNLSVLEGDWIPRFTNLIQFESEESVLQFWNSREYQENVLPIRRGKSALDVFKVGAAFGNQPSEDSETALLIFFVDIEDREKLMNEYVPYAPAIVARFGGKFLVSAAQNNMELLEGDYPSGSFVVVEFPNRTALREFWSDKEYQALSEIRKSTGNWSVVEVVPFSR